MIFSSLIQFPIRKCDTLSSLSALQLPPPSFIAFLHTKERLLTVNTQR